MHVFCSTDSRDEASSDEDSSDDDSVDDVPSVQEEREIAAAAPAQAPTVIVESELLCLPVISL